MTDRERLLGQVAEHEGAAKEHGEQARGWMTGRWRSLVDVDTDQIAAGYAKDAAHHALTALALRKAVDWWEDLPNYEKWREAVTTEEFYTALARKTKRTRTRWAIFPLGCVRAVDTDTGLGEHCPLSFVAGTRSCDIQEASKKIRLRLTTADAIANAADDVDVLPAHDVTSHRSRLLKACGLEGA